MRQFRGQEHGLEKIRSSALRREVMSDDVSPLVVVVEVDLPPAPIEPLMAENSGGIHVSGFRFVAPEPDPEQVSRRVADAREGIRSITGKPPDTFLASSGTFVVEANGEQIRHIAELPSVAAIWANTGF